MTYFVDCSSTPTSECPSGLASTVPRDLASTKSVQSGSPVTNESSHTATPRAAEMLILSFVCTAQPDAVSCASICWRAFSSGVIQAAADVFP